MFCPNCNSPIKNDGARFCSACGAAIAQQDAATSSHPINTHNAVMPQTLPPFSQPLPNKQQHQPQQHGPHNSSPGSASFNPQQDSAFGTPFPEVTFAANNSAGQGGKLHITSDTVFFKPHAFNFGSKQGESFRIEDVCFYLEKAGFVICTTDGHEWVYIVWDQDAIIKAIETRRAYIFQSRGMAVPPLTKERMAAIQEPEQTFLQKYLDYYLSYYIHYLDCNECI